MAHNTHSNTNVDTNSNQRGAGLLRQSDVSAWGLAAIVAFGLAFITSNLSAAIPPRWLAALHETRAQAGVLLPSARAIKALRADLSRTQRANAVLRTRMDLLEGAGSISTRRIGALEASVPIMLEALPGSANIDTSITTAGIDTGSGEIPVEGGSMSVRRLPLFDGANPAGTGPIPFQPMPPELTASPEADPAANADTEQSVGSAVVFGLQIGPPVGEQAPPIVWSDIVDLAGTYLIGMEPLIAKDPDTGVSRLVAGPLSSFSEALALCTVILGLELECKAATYEGTAVFSP